MLGNEFEGSRNDIKYLALSVIHSLFPSSNVRNHSYPSLFPQIEFVTLHTCQSPVSERTAIQLTLGF